MALMTPSFLPSQSYPFGPGAGKTGLRYVMEQLGLQEGVMGAADFKVSQRAAGGAGMFVDIAAGGAWIKGDDTARQGSYHAVNDAVMTLVVPANVSGSPRFDQVVLRAYDSSIAGGTDGIALEVLTGTPNASADIDNRLGAVALPPGAVRLGEWVTPNGAALVSNAMIRDRRPKARGAYLRMDRASDAATSSATMVQFITTAHTPLDRIELAGGNEIEVGLDVYGYAGAAGRMANTQIEVGSVSYPGNAWRMRIEETQSARAESFGGVTVGRNLTPPPAGTHQVVPSVGIPDAATVTLRGSMVAWVREILQG